MEQCTNIHFPPRARRLKVVVLGGPRSAWTPESMVANVSKIPHVDASPLNVEGPVRLLYVTFVAGAAALGGFLFGFDSAVINGAVSGIQRSFGSSAAGTGVA